MSGNLYSGGFADPVFAAQSAFRSVLDALSRPGTVITRQAQSQPPKPLGVLTGDILCTLADADTPVFLCPPLRDTAPVNDWLRFHTGAPMTLDPALAGFAVATDMKFVPALTQFPQGTAEYPDRSTTLILQLDSLEGGQDGVVLSGPGIKGARAFAPKGLPAGFWQQVVMNNAQYPRGIDFLFVSATAIVGLPRSTHIRMQES